MDLLHARPLRFPSGNGEEKLSIIALRITGRINDKRAVQSDVEAVPPVSRLEPLLSQRANRFRMAAKS
jgi:hypothetical protein